MYVYIHIIYILYIYIYICRATPHAPHPLTYQFGCATPLVVYRNLLNPVLSSTPPKPKSPGLSDVPRIMSRFKV